METVFLAWEVEEESGPYLRYQRKLGVPSLSALHCGHPQDKAEKRPWATPAQPQRTRDLLVQEGPSY